MKTFFKLTALLAFLLMLVGGLVSCNNGENYNGDCLYCTNNPCLDDGGLGGEVPFLPCECEQPLFFFQLPQGEAYLFRDYVPQQMRSYIWNKANSYPFPHVVHIIYNSETKIATINIRNLTPAGISTDLLATGIICNFPGFAKKWCIPKNGIRVYFEGRIYRACGGGIADRYHIKYILTYLERILSYE